jgi:hypothetical protein
LIATDVAGQGLNLQGTRAMDSSRSSFHGTRRSSTSASAASTGSANADGPCHAAHVAAPVRVHAPCRAQSPHPRGAASVGAVDLHDDGDPL